MNYDKNSFIAGIAVGRQLKGWASGVNAQDDPSAAVSFSSAPNTSLSAVAVPGAYGGEISVLGILHFGELVELGVSATVAAGGLSDAMTAGVTITDVDVYNIASAGLPGSIGGSIAVEITLEVDA